MNIVNSGVYQITRKFKGEVTKDHKVTKTRKMNKFEEGQFLTDVAIVCWESVVT